MLDIGPLGRTTLVCAKIVRASLALHPIRSFSPLYLDTLAVHIAMALVAEAAWDVNLDDAE